MCLPHQDYMFCRISKKTYITVYLGTPPYIPKVTSADDTSNFDEVEARQPSPRDDIEQPELRDLPFIGFTSYRNLALLKAKQ